MLGLFGTQNKSTITRLTYNIVIENKNQGNRDVLNGWGLVYVHFAVPFRLIPHNPTKK